MTKIEKIGLFLGIPASIIAISDWLSDSINLMPYIISSGKYIIFLITKIFYFIIDIFTFEIQLWVILLIVSILFFINKFKDNLFKTNKISLSKQYEELSENQRNIFTIILVTNEQGKKCTYNHIVHSIKYKQFNISNLETQEILESLEEIGLIGLQTEWMDDSHYLLTSKGRSLAVILIKGTN